MKLKYFNSFHEEKRPSLNFFLLRRIFEFFILQAKHESTIGELEEKLRKDNQQRQEVERAKRKIETELNDLKEQVGEKKMQVSN